MKPKQRAWNWMSKYVRLRDALNYCKCMRINISQFSMVEDIICKCCTCNKVKPWIRMDAGHFYGRGLGGASGTYFREDNVHCQCKQCNAFMGGNFESYMKFMLRKYGSKKVELLERLHKLGKTYQAGEIDAIGLYYKDRYDELVNSV